MTEAAPAPLALDSTKPAIKLTLRLDDGTIIRTCADDTAEVLKPSEAWKAGLLNESHLLRMQSLLCQVHAKLPDAGPLKSVSLGSKRSIDSVLEVGQTVSAKRSRSVGDLLPTEAPTFAPAAPAPPVTDWVKICQRLVDFLLTQVLGPSAFIFKGPVDTTYVKDYYNVIAKPIYFDKITEKLQAGVYSGPQDFYNDVLLLCDNCYRYNVEVHPSEFGPVGVTMENAFLTAWAKTPFVTSVPPRPLRPMPPRAKSQPAKKSPGGAAARAVAGRPRGGVGRGRPGRPPGVARTKSVNSYGAMVHAVYTPEMQSQLVAALNDPAILEANMEGVVNILSEAGEMGVDEDGEATLDLEKVTPPTALKLYDLVVVKTGRVAMNGAAHRQVDQEDDDWDPDEEDDE